MGQLAWLHSGDRADPLFDAAERAQLSDLLGELGPEAPTLLAPWTTCDCAGSRASMSFFVHHEDVRRANGRGPRTNDQAMDEALWRNVSRASWYLARRLRGAGLELQWAGTAKTVRARRGEPTARAAGPPGELLLNLFGRPGAAQVEVSGPDAAVEAVRRARFGM